MEPKRSKYDTNPLDENVADRAEQSWGSKQPASRENIDRRKTNDIARSSSDTARANPESEAPTRRIDDDLGTAYPSIFVQPPPRQAAPYEPPRFVPENIYQPPPVPPPNIYLPPPLPAVQPGSRTVPGINIPEKWANMLAYTPGYIGMVVSVIELLLVPRSEARTRFHAAQAFGLYIAIAIISILFRILSVATGSGAGRGLFSFAAFVFLIVSMVRVWKGKPHHIPPLDEATKWFDEKIKPRN